MAGSGNAATPPDHIITLNYISEDEARAINRSQPHRVQQLQAMLVTTGGSFTGSINDSGGEILRLCRSEGVSTAGLKRHVQQTFICF